MAVIEAATGGAERETARTKSSTLRIMVSGAHPESIGAERWVRLRSGDVTWQPVEDEVIVLDLRSSRYTSVNQAGAALWEAIVDGATVGALQTALKERYGLDDATAVRDVTAFLDVLDERGLLDAGESDTGDAPR
jgi:coenzyme PQQ synthesis protein D (PqqD)